MDLDKNNEFINDLRSVLDKKRFEEQVIDNQVGFYDKIERVFIPESVFITLYNSLKPAYKLSAKDLENMINSSIVRTSKTLNDVDTDGKDSYAQIFLTYLSHKYLLDNKNQTKNMVILYIDLVGSTALTAITTPEQLSLIVRIFCQEISLCISRFFGYVLKYAGDAVIGYFPEGELLSKKDLYEHVIRCAFYMQKLLDESINLVLFKNQYPKLRSRISIDAGANQIVLLGSEPDLLGHVISRSAKIMSKAPPNNIVIGHNIYKNLNNITKKKFSTRDKFMLFETGEIYSIYISNK